MFDWSALSKKAVDLGKKAVEIVSEDPPDDVAGSGNVDDQYPETQLQQRMRRNSSSSSFNNNNNNKKKTPPHSEDDEETQSERHNHHNNTASVSSASSSIREATSNWASQLRDIVAPRPSKSNTFRPSSTTTTNGSERESGHRLSSSLNNNTTSGSQDKNNHVADPLQLVKQAEVIASQKEEIDSLSSALSRVAKERDDYQLALEQREIKIALNDQERKKLMSEVTLAKSEIANLNKTIHQLQEERIATQNSDQQQRQEQQEQQNIDQQHKLIAATLEANDGIRNELQKSSQIRPALQLEVDQLKQQHEKLKQDQHRYKAELEALKEQISTLESEKRSRQASIAALNGELKSVSDANCELTSKLSSLQREIAQFNSDQSDLAMEIDDARDKQEELSREEQNLILQKRQQQQQQQQNDNLAANSETENLRVKIDQLQRQNQDLQLTSEKLRLEYDARLAENESIASLKIQQLEEQISSLHRQIERSSATEEKQSNDAEEKQQHQQQVLILQEQHFKKEQEYKTELSQMQQNFEEQLNRLEEDSSAREKKLEQAIEVLTSRNNILSEQVSKSRREYEALQKDTIARLSEAQRNDSTTSQRVQVLESTVNELRSEKVRLTDCVNQSLDICVEALNRAGLSLNKNLQSSSSQSPSSSSSSPSSPTLGTSSSSNHHHHPCVIAVEQICDAWEKEREVHARDTVRLTQWASTYEQAKVVNQQLNQQLQVLQSQLDGVREDGAMQQAGVERLRELVQVEQEQSRNVTAQLQRALSEKQDMEMVLDRAREEISRLQSSLTQQSERLDALERERTNFDGLLSEKESELDDARRSSDNLQAVLERFQADKQRDIQEQARVLNYELDDLRGKLQRLHDERTHHNEELEAIEKSHRREVSAKTSMIMTLQTKLGELRNALEEAVEKLGDKQTIDKRIVTGLVLNYIQSISDVTRNDSLDMLRAMSGLLSWDEEAKEKSGLVPGPLNPKRQNSSSSSSRGGGIFGWITSSATSSTPTTSTATTTATDPNKSLSEMWVDFLMKESAVNAAAAAVGNSNGGGGASTAGRVQQQQHQQVASSTAEVYEQHEDPERL